MHHIKINSPADILDAVPSLLRFWPTESLVALYFDVTPTGEAVLALTARTDLPDTPQQRTSFLASNREMAEEHTEVILVIYSADHGHAANLMRDLLHTIPTGLPLSAILATIDGWTTLETDHPDDESPIHPYNRAAGTVAEQLAEHGARPEGTRAELADSIQAPDAATEADYELGSTLDIDTTNPSPEHGQEITEQIQGWIRVYLQLPTTVVAEEAAWLAARLRHNPARDAAILAVNRSNAAALSTLWQQIAAMTPDRDAIPVLAVLAHAAWVSGHGALGNVALERAATLPHGPGSALLDMVATALQLRLPPAAWEQMKKEI